LPDKFTSKSRSFDRNSYGEKDRELPKAAKGFFLVQGIAVERFRALRWWAFESENCLSAPMFINCTNVSIRTVRPLTQNPC
jgi:hypothetical protein